jgi:transposase
MKPSKRVPQEELFPFVAMEQLIPQNHILRYVNRYVDFSFIDELVDHTYSETTGRYATDPELMIRILTIGYLYNLSERKLFEELTMHAAYRWFCGLGFTDKIPDRSTLNKLRNHRWACDGIFHKILSRIVEQCIQAGLVSGKHLAVDGTKIRANASIKSLEPIVVEVGVDEYLGRLELTTETARSHTDDKHPEDKDFRGKKLSNETHRSTSDPEARLYRKSPGQETALSYIGNYLIDTKSRVILATNVAQPGISTETDAANEMLDSLMHTGFAQCIKTLAADTAYGSTSFITDCIDRGIVPHIPLLAKSDYEPEPSWKTKTYIPERLRKRQRKVKEVHARNLARIIARTAVYRLSQKLRKRIEHLFAEAKTWHGLNRARCRGLRAVQQQIDMTAAVQNIKRLVGFMRRTQKNVGILDSLSVAHYSIPALVTTFRSLIRHFYSFLYDTNLIGINFILLHYLKSLSFSPGF